MADYRRELLKILAEHGCTFVRHANGSHELWQSPISGTRFVVQHDLRPRTSANNIRKQVGIAKKL